MRHFHLGLFSVICVMLGCGWVEGSIEITHDLRFIEESNSNETHAGQQAWTKLFRKDTEVHVVRGTHNIYLCVNGKDRFILNRPEGPRRKTEKRRLEKKYTKAGFKVLLQKCYYYIVQKKWKVGGKPVIRVVKQRVRRKVRPLVAEGRRISPSLSFQPEAGSNITNIDFLPSEISNLTAVLNPALQISNLTINSNTAPRISNLTTLPIPPASKSFVPLPIPTFAHDRDWGNEPFDLTGGRDLGLLHVLKPLKESNATGSSHDLLPIPLQNEGQ